MSARSGRDAGFDKGTNIDAGDEGIDGRELRNVVLDLLWVSRRK
jgi:hypothetical protein